MAKCHASIELTIYPSTLSATWRCRQDTSYLTLHVVLLVCYINNVPANVVLIWFGTEL